jgi:hypothetical protein
MTYIIPMHVLVIQAAVEEVTNIFNLSFVYFFSNINQCPKHISFNQNIQTKKLYRFLLAYINRLHTVIIRKVRSDTWLEHTAEVTTSVPECHVNGI